MKYNIFLVDDHKIFRDGFKLLLKSINDIGTIDEAANGQEFLEKIENKKPDVVFMDVVMPVMDGAEATKKALKKYPGLKIIALSGYDNDDIMNKMIYAGVEGYITKDTDASEIQEAIKQVMDGNNYFSNHILIKLTKNTMKKKTEEKRLKNLPRLTRRELEILGLLCKGLTKWDIASQLDISERTVEKHKENLMTKTETKSTVNLILFALKNKISSIK